MTRICLSVLLCGVVFAQSPQGKLAFEVASIRPGPSGTMMELLQSGKIYSTVDDSRVAIGSFPLAALIQMAYRVPPDQIVGPDWMMGQRFDVQAKLPEGASKDQVPEMLQTLLAERFRLAIHHDRKVLPVYALTVGKDGPKFHESAGEDSASTGCNGGLHKVCRGVTMGGPRGLPDQW